MRKEGLTTKRAVAVLSNSTWVLCDGNAIGDGAIQVSPRENMRIELVFNYRVRHGPSNEEKWLRRYASSTEVGNCTQQQQWRQRAAFQR